ncbi:MAG: apolipoprotein N-acyltransferase [Pseudomonadota bacterium]
MNAALQAPIFIALGAAMGLAHPPFGLAPLTLFALIGVLWALNDGLTFRRLFLLGWLFGCGHFAVAMHWIVEPFLVVPEMHGWMAPFGLVFMAGGLALFWGAAFTAYRCGGRLGLVTALCLAELARAHLMTGLPWALPSHAWIGTWGYLRAAWVGPHGLMLALGLLALLGSRSGPAAAAVALAAVGVWTPALPDAPQPSADRPTIRLAQPNAPQHQKWDPAHMPTFYARLLTATAAEPPVDLVVWPETAVPFWLDQGIAEIDDITMAARGAPVALGIRRFEAGEVFNSSALLGDGGAVLASYDKRHLVPFGEYVPFAPVLGALGVGRFAQDTPTGFTPGASKDLWEVEGIGGLRVLICYETIFPEEILGDERPDALLVLTNDAWYGQFAGPFQHLALAQARAIEFGLPVIRSANTGVSAIIDPQGRILTSLALGETGYVDGRLPEPAGETFYAKTSDWPALILALVLLALSPALRRFSY